MTGESSWGFGYVDCTISDAIQTSMTRYLFCRDELRRKQADGAGFFKTLWAEWKMMRARDEMIALVLKNDSISRLVFYSLLDKPSKLDLSRTDLAEVIVQECRRYRTYRAQ